MSSRRGRSWTAGGAAVCSTGASLVAAASTAACCAGPGLATLLVAMGGAGAAASASVLRPFSPYLSAGSLLVIAAGFWSIRRSRGGPVDGTPSRPRVHLLVRVLLWLALVVWVASAALQLHFLP